MPGRLRQVRLAPSLLSADFADLAEAVRRCEAGGAEAFHLDVMDGHFVPNLSFGPALVAAVRARTRLPLDVHLMISRPATYAKSFARAGGTTLVFHVESDDPVDSTVREIRSLGVEVGIAVKPETPLDAVAPVLPHVDQLMVMGVHPGFSGQSYLPGTTEKIGAARHALDALGSDADLSIDGGVTTEILPQAVRAGATFVVCGSSVFGPGGIGPNLEALRRAVEGATPDAVR